MRKTNINSIDHSLTNFPFMVNSSNSLKIILIDDDIILNLIHRKILNFIGFKGEVLDFNNGLQALNYINQEFQTTSTLNLTPTLIILDLEMPVLNGWEFLKSFGALDSCVKKQFKIIVSSSSTNVEDINNALQFEIVDEYISKPLTIEIIQRIVGGCKDW
ncbi:response regulator [Aquiflexum lacus]|uniref:response regulator n=1 Tax=Aquiflexum lacus TaxID=2483805 RepID=UPI001895CB89|nr:response regulator [Aquiflexum lacus]